MKRIVVCCDGTWSAADRERDGEAAPTNVVRFADAVTLADAGGVDQRVYYQPGVGSDGNWLYRWFAGATGWGLSDNLKDAYRYLVETYRPGDEIYLFGYSRGAFTVRSLAGLVFNAGVLRPEAAGRVDEAFGLYKSRSPRKHPEADEAVAFRQRFAHEDRTPIRFIGVWDTVGALGNPLLMHRSPLSRRVQFHDTRLTPTVRCACHALAIDETRRHFKATRWQATPDRHDQRLEQRWFVGAHGDIGGGSPNGGLSDLTFDWMRDRARECGLAVSNAATRPDVLQGPARSRRGLFRLVPPWYRPIAPAGSEARGEVVDESADRRWREDSGYRPPNLADYRRGL
jgi:uncharacterized protein (DUF2235 family)